MIFDVDVVNDEFWAMITRLNRTLETRHLAFRFTNDLRRRFREEVAQSFASEGPAGEGSWAPLSPLRREIRGSSNPILTDSGSFASEVMGYKGEVRLINSGFSMWYPSHREASGRYWGLTAGQMVNPLGMSPLAMWPRRVLGGNDRQRRESIEALMWYFQTEGWVVDIG